MTHSPRPHEELRRILNDYAQTLRRLEQLAFEALTRREEEVRPPACQGTSRGDSTH